MTVLKTEFESHLCHGLFVPHCIQTHIGHEQGKAAGEALGAGEAAVSRACHQRRPKMEVCHVLRALSPEYLQHQHR